MAQISVTDFIPFLNNQIHQHEQLNHLLLQIQYVMDFTASHNLEDINPLQLNAQFIAMEKLIQEAQALNMHLQRTLAFYQPAESP